MTDDATTRGADRAVTLSHRENTARVLDLGAGLFGADWPAAITETVTFADLGASLLTVCDWCGAVVTASSAADHADWHGSVNATLNLALTMGVVAAGIKAQVAAAARDAAERNSRRRWSR